MSLPLRAEGRSRKSAFYYGAMSAIVEPIAVVLGAYAVMSMPQLLSYALSFAAGAMIYVVVEKTCARCSRTQEYRYCNR